MAKKKNGSKKERAVVGRERMLALALRSVLDAIDAVADDPNAKGDEVTNAVNAAGLLLLDLGYDGLESITKRVSRLNEQLKAAVESSDGKEISRLGLELERAKLGKPPLAVKSKPAAVAAAASE